MGSSKKTHKFQPLRRGTSEEHLKFLQDVQRGGCTISSVLGGNGLDLFWNNTIDKYNYCMTLRK